MKIKHALEACLKRTGLDLHSTEIDALTELELLEILTRLMEFAKNIEATQYYQQSRQMLNTIQTPQKENNG